jgi:hypothetical protein
MIPPHGFNKNKFVADLTPVGKQSRVYWRKQLLIKILS